MRMAHGLSLLQAILVANSDQPQVIHLLRESQQLLANRCPTECLEWAVCLEWAASLHPTGCPSFKIFELNTVIQQSKHKQIQKLRKSCTKDSAPVSM